MIVFGTVPSRRLRRSMGINNVPPKICSYGCLYCQVGITDTKSIKRQFFYSPEKIFSEVEKKLIQPGIKPVDYLTFVSDGEPTLDIELGKVIKLLKNLGIKIAVITNASLLWIDKVKEDLNNADYVSIKIDSTDENTWRKINVPNKELNLLSILKSMIDFSSEYKGILTTETMLIRNINDSKNNILKIADYISLINPDIAYIAVPTRPTAARNIFPASSEVLNFAHTLFSSKKINVKFLNDYEGNDFAHSGNIEEDILTISAVHPIRKDAVEELLQKSGKDWSVINALLNSNLIQEKKYDNHLFYIRKFKTN